MTFHDVLMTGETGGRAGVLVALRVDGRGRRCDRRHRLAAEIDQPYQHKQNEVVVFMCRIGATIEFTGIKSGSEIFIKVFFGYFAPKLAFMGARNRVVYIMFFLSLCYLSFLASTIPGIPVSTD